MGNRGGKVFLIAAILFSLIYLPLQIPSVKSKIFPSPISKPTITPTPASSRPSERALQAAAYMWANSTAAKQTEIKNRYGWIDATSSEVVRKWALLMDEDSALLYTNEALIEKNKNSTSNTYTPQTVSESVILNNNTTNNTQNRVQELQNQQKQQCQEQINKYTLCLADYNAKINEYQDCYSRYSGNSNLHPEFLCTKPSNFCYKPGCAY